MAETKTYTLEIVSPERKVFSGDVEFGVFPGSEGELGILPNHAAMLCALVPGQIKIVRNKKPEFFATSGGFLEVRSNKAAVILDTCEAASEIDLERATRAKDAALLDLGNQKEKPELVLAKQNLKKAEARIKVAATVTSMEPAKH